MKTKRNDPCPCGSGKKYKKCCLQKTQESPKNIFIIADTTSIQMLEIVENNKGHFSSNYKKPAMDLRRSMIIELENKTSGKQAVEVLEKYLFKIEKEISRILSRCSKYYWLYLSRRIAPEPVEQVSEWTVNLARMTFNLGILKHGCDDKSGSLYKNEFVVKSESVFPKALTYMDCLNIYQVEYLSYEHNAITSLLRRIWKGGVLRISGGDIDVTHTKTQEKLIELYDKRLGKYNKLLSSFGSRLDVFPKIKDVSKKSKTIIVPYLNVTRVPFPFAFPGEKIEISDSLTGEYRPNYLYVPMDLTELLNLASLFENKIIELYGFTPRELVLFLMAISHRKFLLIKDNREARYQLLQRGYDVIFKGEKYQTVFDDWANFYREFAKFGFGNVISNDSAKQAVDKIIKCFTYSKEDLDNISLWDKVPFKLFFETHEGLILDLAAIPFIFHTIFEPLASLDDTHGNLKGKNYEKEVKALFKKEANIKLWECQNKLETKANKRRQIDVSFIHNNILYVLECKAFCVNFLINRGERTALKKRWETLEKYLKQVISLAEFLEENPEGKNYKLPSEIKKIEPVVCSAFPEYIPTLENKYWLDEKTPRVCVPEELIKFLEN